MKTETNIHINSHDCISQAEMIAYIQGKLSTTDMHRVERHMLECDMCNDEFEGLQLLENPETIHAITNDLNNQILKNSAPKKVFAFPTKRYMIAAASILIIFGVGFLAHTLIETKRQTILITENRSNHNDSQESPEIQKPIILENSNFIEKSRISKKFGTLELKKCDVVSGVSSDNSALYSQNIDESNKLLEVAEPIEESFQLSPAPLVQKEMDEAETQVTKKNKNAEFSRASYDDKAMPSMSAPAIEISPAYYTKGTQHDFCLYVVSSIKKQKEFKNVTGVVSINCLINATGKIEVVKILIPNNQSLEKAIVLLLQSNENWEPATLKGKNQASSITFDFDFGR